MKRLIILIFVLASLLQIANAQSFFGINADAGFAWQFDNLDYTHAQIGFDFSIGGTYQWQKDKFLLQTGFGISPHWLTQRIEDETIEVSMLDTEGIPFIYKGYVEGRADKTLALDVSIPMMLGVKYKSFYTLLGVKCYIPLVNKSHVTAYLTTIGDYGDRHYGVLKDMPQHGFFSNKLVSMQDKFQTLPDLRLCAEFGLDIQKIGYSLHAVTSCIQLGVFIEYGILNTLRDGPYTSITQVDCTKYMDIKMQHIYTAQKRTTTHINSLRAGLRATILFPVKECKTCKLQEYI